MKSERKLHTYLFEIFAIIIGITASLMLEDWRDSHNKSEMQLKYFEKLVYKLEIDSLDMAWRLQYLNERLEHSLVLADYIDGKYKVEDSVTFITNAISIGQVNAFQVQNNLFEEMKMSGMLNQIENDSLLDLLDLYYDPSRNIQMNQLIMDRSLGILNNVVKCYPVRLQYILDRNDTIQLASYLNDRPETLSEILACLKNSKELKEELKKSARQYFYMTDVDGYFQLQDEIVNILNAYIKAN